MIPLDTIVQGDCLVMTLTEEQREAIRVISKLPMAIGCQLCHPYIMKNYGSHFIVLRDMIDSSGTVEPREGFDLEAARDLANNPIHCPETDEVFRKCVAEIERLRAENLELQVAVFGPDGIRANQACIIVDQAARISDLEIEITGLKADLEQSEEIKRLKDELENYGDHYACLLISKDAQIKELEGMLSIRTEELDIAHSVARSEKEMHEKELAAFARRIKELEDAHKRSGKKYAKIINELRSSVYANIPGLDVGKIGPDAKPRSWQITDERKAALAAMSNLSETISCPDCGVWIGFADIGPHMAVLRAMLREAE